jgi:GAF domain-containing protein
MGDGPVRDGERLRGLHPEHADEEGAAAAALVPLLTDYLDDVARRTEARLDGALGVAVTMSLDEEPWSVGVSNDLAGEVDLIQYEVGVGPCLYALSAGEVIYVPDLAADDRWGDYGPRAAARGAAACISVPVLVDDRPAAVLKVYAGEVDGLSPEDRAVAESVVAEVAGGIRLALHLATQAQQLDDRQAAMNSRRTIDLALGVLMERTQSGAASAFELLRSLSQTRNIKLNAAARQVLSSVAGATEADVQAPFTGRHLASASARTKRTASS